MTIVAARAVPYSVMADFLAGVNPTNSIASMAHQFDRVWIISVTNGVCDGTYKLLITEELEDRIALQFDDIQDKYTPNGVQLPRDPQLVYFNDTMAKKVMDFIRRAHESRPESQDLLVVNCHMGISRSGAISDFARTVCGQDYDEWKRMNQGVIPNMHVKSLLMGAWKG